MKLRFLFLFSVFFLLLVSIVPQKSNFKETKGTASDTGKPECEIKDAKVILSKTSINPLNTLTSIPNFKTNCSYDVSNYFTNDDYNFRDAYITSDKNWIIVLTGTGVLGQIDFIHSSSGKHIKKLYLDQIEIIDSNSFYFLTRKNCQKATKFKFAFGKIVTLGDIPYGSCDF